MVILNNRKQGRLNVKQVQKHHLEQKVVSDKDPILIHNILKDPGQQVVLEAFHKIKMLLKSKNNQVDL